MERTLSVSYPVLRQKKGVLLNTFVKKHSHYILFCTFHQYLSLLASRIDVTYNVVSFDRGAFRTYSIIHPYFALVQGSSH